MKQSDLSIREEYKVKIHLGLTPPRNSAICYEAHAQMRWERFSRLRRRNFPIHLRSLFTLGSFSSYHYHYHGLTDKRSWQAQITTWWILRMKDKVDKRTLGSV